MEYWDTYDRNWQPLGGVHPRGTPLPQDVYHLVVAVWTCNSRGQLLLTLRHPRKSSGNCWECTGGCAQAGDDPLSTAKRELLEETGLSPVGLTLLGRDRIDAPGDPQLCCSYLNLQDASLDQLVLQKTEVTRAIWATPKQVDELAAEGPIEPSTAWLWKKYRRQICDAGKAGINHGNQKR